MARLPIPSDWDGNSWCCHVVEWPSSPEWTAILLGYVSSPSIGWTWDERTGSVIDARDTGLKIWQRNIQEGCIVGCLDDLKASLSDLTLAVYNSGCGCGGSGGAGATAGPAPTFADNGTSNFPDGYTDRAEYQDAKCRLAQFVIDRMLADFQKLRVINVSSASASSLATILGIALITPIPFDDMLVGVAVAVLGLYALAANALSGSLDELEARVSSMDICELYGAATADDAVANVQSWISGGTYTYGPLASQLGSYMIGVDAVAPLFSPPGGTINASELPAADCSGCVEPEWWTCRAGTIIAYGPDYVELSSVVGGDGMWRVSLGKQDVIPTSFSVSQIGAGWTAPTVVPAFATAIEYGPTLDVVCSQGAGGSWDQISSSLVTGTFPDAGILLYRSSTPFDLRIDVVF